MPLFPELASLLGTSPSEFTLAAVLLNMVIGAVAAVLLGRLATSFGCDGRWAVVALATAPSTLFLTAPYTEALFLMLALGAWAAALKDHYWLMGVLSGLAVLTRLNGLFLVVALFVLLLVGRRGLTSVAGLSVPIIAAIGWQTPVTRMSGQATTVLDVQRDFWNNSLGIPFQLLRLAGTPLLTLNGTKPIPLSQFFTFLLHDCSCFHLRS